MSNEQNEPDQGAVTTERGLTRRQAIGVVTVGGTAALLAACGSSAKTTATTAAATATTIAATATTKAGTATTASATATTTAATAAAADTSTATPTETGGPFPADGTNDNGNGVKVNILSDARSVRSDIRSDLDGTNTQEGTPMTLTMTVVQKGGAALANAAVYIWHCTKEGVYSEYNSTMIGGDFTARSYLRGVQVTDASGKVTFKTIMPGRYKGRAFHIHFEVYKDKTYGTKVLTSQIGMDDTALTALYKSIGYTSALANVTTNTTDNVFSDGFTHQMLTMSGDATALNATFTAVV
jgi:protocatechuate 3,4-dioxygenase beta subunit